MSEKNTSTEQRKKRLIDLTRIIICEPAKLCVKPKLIPQHKSSIHENLYFIAFSLRPRSFSVNFHSFRGWENAMKSRKNLQVSEKLHDDEALSLSRGETKLQSMNKLNHREIRNAINILSTIMENCETFQAAVPFKNHRFSLKLFECPWSSRNGTFSEKILYK